MLTINEIFYSIQGEATRAGEPCVFVRLTACDLRCSWCDTAYAFYEGQKRSIDDVVSEVEGHQCRLVEITGGEPLLQEDVYPLMDTLLDRGYTVMLETGGHRPIARVPSDVIKIMDVKCPGSGESDKNHWENLDALTPHDEVKFVVKDRADYEFAREVIARYDLPSRVAAVLLSPVHGVLDPRILSEWMLADHLQARLQLQLHKLIWSPETRGVASMTTCRACSAERGPRFLHGRCHRAFEGFSLYALTIDYGQRHAQELAAARRVAASLGVARHLELTLDLRGIGGSALTSDVPVPRDRDLAAVDIPSTYVPARNTIFLSIALGWAETLDARDLFIGVNALDYSGYPDCRPEFITAFESLAAVATRAGVEGARFHIHTPLITLSKAEIIRRGLALGLDYGLTHSCYDPDPMVSRAATATVASCGPKDLRKRAFATRWCCVKISRS